MAGIIEIAEITEIIIEITGITGTAVRAEVSDVITEDSVADIIIRGIQNTGEVTAGILKDVAAGRLTGMALTEACVTEESLTETGLLKGLRRARAVLTA
ncbi:MAG: hypothetical protein K2K09_03440 [Lachnospiraceae bacterium]|nr:hypothetical protein [Lachnospiraceae bacterium]